MNRFIRVSHRWLSMLFTAAVVFTTVALSQPKPAAWVSYTPLPPLGLLFLTGLYCSRCRTRPSGGGVR